jgi:hypothetical protein
MMAMRARFKRTPISNVRSRVRIGEGIAIPKKSSLSVKECLATLDDTVWGAAGDVVPKFVSPSDPAASGLGLTRDRHSSLTPTTI